MKGNLLFEQIRIGTFALKSLKSVRAVYEELGKYIDLENQVLCHERFEELAPNIRYCLRKIGDSNLQASQLLQIGEMEGPALDLFKANLEAVMGEARSQQAALMTEFNWLGHRSSIRNDLANAGNSKNMKDDLSGLDKAIDAVLGQQTLERNQLCRATDDLPGFAKKNGKLEPSTALNSGLKVGVPDPVPVGKSFIAQCEQEKLINADAAPSMMNPKNTISQV
ncbi:hypothetical protein AgCh_014158 [Apium graveolens]